MLEEDSLLVQSKPKSTQYKEKWAVEVFRSWQAAREQKFCILDPGSVFKDYDLHRVQSLKEKLEDMDSLSLTIGSQNASQKLLIRTVVAISASFLVWNCLWLKAPLGGHKWRNALNPLDSSNKALFKLCIAFSN